MRSYIMAKSETGNVRQSHICAEELRFAVVAKICFESLKEVSEVPRKQSCQLVSSLTPDAGGHTGNYGSNAQMSCQSA